MNFLKTIWSTWKAIAHRIGTFQSRLLLSVFYFVIVAPFALGLKLFSDPLGLSRRAPRTWLRRPPAEADPRTGARRQF